MTRRDARFLGLKRFVVLDRDGTIIQERHYLSNPDEVDLVPGAAAGLRNLRDMGLGMVMITNQSGIGRGYFDEPRLSQVHQRLCRLLEAEGVLLNGIYFCPHTPEDNCMCRKPRAALLELAAKELDFDGQGCFVIGDKACDIELGQSAGAITFLVSTGYGAQVGQDGDVSPDYAVKDLPEAAHIIRGLLSPAHQSEN